MFKNLLIFENKKEKILVESRLWQVKEGEILNLPLMGSGSATDFYSL